MIMQERWRNAKNGLRKLKRLRVSNLIAFTLLIVHIFTLIPLFQIAQYNVPSADDYTSAVSVRNKGIYSEKISIPEKIAASIEDAINSWKTFQGTFSSTLFATPLLFAGQQESYANVSKILILLFHCSLLFMLWKCLHRALGMQWQYVISIYVVVATAMVQMLPSVSEGFYWLSGALLYTGFFCLAMIAVGLLVDLMKTQRRIVIVLLNILLSLVGFVLGGSNYPTAVAMFLIFAYSLGFLLLYRNKKAWRVLMPMLVCMAGVLLNVLAPGNSARLEREGVQSQTDLSRTINIAFMLGKQFVREWVDLPLVILMVIAVPLIVAALRYTKCRFYLPFCWIILAWMGYVATFMPCAYSYGWIGPQRYMNIVYFAFVFMVFSVEIYVIGWLMQGIRDILEKKKEVYEAIAETVSKAYKKSSICFIAIVIFLVNIALSPNFYFDNRIPSARDAFSSERAVKEMQNWCAQIYYTQYRERVAMYEDEKIEDVVVAPYTHIPSTLYFDDITENASDWRNVGVASYYGKKSVVLEKQEE